MPDIRPISDLRSRFAEISRLAHQSGEPVFLTKNGYGDLVVLSVEAYQKLLNQIKMQNTPPHRKISSKANSQEKRRPRPFGSSEKIRAAVFILCRPPIQVPSDQVMGAGLKKHI